MTTQDAYNQGRDQMHDRGLPQIMGWVSAMVDDEPNPGIRFELRAAVLEGCAEALTDYADNQRAAAELAYAQVDGVADVLAETGREQDR